MRTVIILILAALSSGLQAESSSLWDFDPGIPRLDVQSTPTVNGQGSLMWTDNLPLGFRAGQAPFSDQASLLTHGAQPLPLQSQQIPEPGMVTLAGALGLMLAVRRRKAARTVVRL